MGEMSMMNQGVSNGQLGKTRREGIDIPPSTACTVFPSDGSHDLDIFVVGPPQSRKRKRQMVVVIVIVIVVEK